MENKTNQNPRVTVARREVQREVNRPTGGYGLKTVAVYDVLLNGRVLSTHNLLRQAKVQARHINPENYGG